MALPADWPPFEKRFWSRVDKRGPNECWLWTGALTKAGYGQIRRDGGTRTSVPAYAHRVSWELQVGPIPEGMTIDHLCINRHCMNVQHMETVTLSENGRRGAERRWRK